jgi:hypothetical protein
MITYQLGRERTEPDAAGSVEVATGAQAAEGPRPQGIGHAINAVTAGFAGLRLLPTESYDALAAVDLQADAAVALRVLVGVFEEDLALVRGLDRENETSVMK